MCLSWHPFKGLWNSDSGRLLIAIAILRAGFPACTFLQLHLGVNSCQEKASARRLTPEVLQRLATMVPPRARLWGWPLSTEFSDDRSANQQVHFPFDVNGTLTVRHPGGL